MGSILTFTGVSGVGKTTLARGFLAVDSRASLFESTTTRSQRLSDLPGEYRYLAADEFAELETQGGFLWTAKYGDTRYGALRISLDRIIDAPHKIGVMILTPSGVDDLRRHLESIGKLALHVPVFVTEPSREELLQRLIERGESRESIAERLEVSSTWESDARQQTKIRYTFIKNDAAIDVALGCVTALFA